MALLNDVNWPHKRRHVMLNLMEYPVQDIWEVLVSAASDYACSKMGTCYAARLALAQVQAELCTREVCRIMKDDSPESVGTAVEGALQLVRYMLFKLESNLGCDQG